MTKTPGFPPQPPPPGKPAANGQSVRSAEPPVKGYHAFYFSQLLGRRICAGKIHNKIGRLTDIVFKLTEPYPEAVGLFISHGWGRPTEFIPWERVVKIDDETAHAQHFFMREAGTERPMVKYLDRFGEIRRLQQFIVEQAEREGVPVIENENAERATRAVADLVLSAAERVGERV